MDSDKAMGDLHCVPDYNENCPVGLVSACKRAAVDAATAPSLRHWRMEAMAVESHTLDQVEMTAIISKLND